MSNHPSFYTPLDLQWVDTPEGRQNFKVLEAFKYLTFQGPNGYNLITVPVGFVTDLASIPQPLWDLLPPDGPYGKAAVLHDYLYRTGGGDNAPPFTKAQADNVLLEAMGVLAVPGWKKYMIYTAVHLFGGSSWKVKGS